jgi:hypothetical protein
MSGRPDRLTLAAIGVVAYAVADVVHEGLGHLGACVLLGGGPTELSTMYAAWQGGLSGTAERLAAAGGSLANLAAAALAVALLKAGRGRTPAGWCFLWVFAAVNLMQATGYLLFSGLGNVGDWAAVVRGWRPAWAWRLGLAVAGGASYFLTVRWMIHELAARIDLPSPARVGEAYAYTLVPYLSGCALFVAAGLTNPAGLAMVAVSALASSLGGTSGFAWGPQLLHDPDIPSAPGPVEPLTRDWRWVALAAAVAVAFISVLGPGVRFGPSG